MARVKQLAISVRESFPGQRSTSLRRAGPLVAVEPQVFDVLHNLIRNREQRGQQERVARRCLLRVKGGHVQRTRLCPLSANSGHEQKQRPLRSGLFTRSNTVNGPSFRLRCAVRAQRIFSLLFSGIVRSPRWSLGTPLRLAGLVAALASFGSLSAWFSNRLVFWFSIPLGLLIRYGAFLFRSEIIYRQFDHHR